MLAARARTKTTPTLVRRREKLRGPQKPQKHCKRITCVWCDTQLSEIAPHTITLPPHPRHIFIYSLLTSHPLSFRHTSTWGGGGEGVRVHPSRMLYTMSAAVRTCGIRAAICVEFFFDTRSLGRACEAEYVCVCVFMAVSRLLPHA